MDLIRNLVRGLALLLGIPIAAIGALGVNLASSKAGSTAHGLVARLLDSLDGQFPWADANLSTFLRSPIGHYGLIGAGGVLILIGLMWKGDPLTKKGSKKGKEEEEDEAPPKIAPNVHEYDKKTKKRFLKEAAYYEKEGQFKEAADLYLGLGEHERALKLLLKAGLYSHAAGVKHDQNLFVEAAELYVEGGEFSSAAALFEANGEPLKAAECYERLGTLSSAGEMYEAAGKYGKAADCFAKAEYFRHAASCYVKIQSWEKAADALEQVVSEEKTKLSSSGSDPKKEQELRKLVLQTAKLWSQAGNKEKSQAVLLRGGCFEAAAELAFEMGAFEEAADYYQRARNPQKAADALRKVDKGIEADRILGGYYRDLGDDEKAALHFEQAEEFGEAGDIYRRIEQFEKAGECLEKSTDFYPAAEMFRACGDLQRAGECFEKAGAYEDAADCFADAGDAEKNASLLEKGGHFFAAGKRHHDAGREEEAITVLQQVEVESADFRAASALLGEIFLRKKKISLAMKKLRQAVADQELSPENVQAYFLLARACGAQGNWVESVEIFEKVMAFDYHFNEVETFLEKARAGLKKAEEARLKEEAAKTKSATHQTQDGRYEIIDELGRGGMGIVYKAKDTVLDREVAYKVLPEELKENKQALKSFLAEAKAAASLNHPGIVCVYDAGEQDGRFYIAMEMVDGTTLKDIIRRRGAIAPGGVMHVLAQMCEALAYAHDKKIAHRDIKPANTMWTRDKKAKIMDFGLAKLIEEVRNHTTVVSGTPYYMSPEQTLGKNVDHRTDIYSLGVSIFELATGELPFKEGNVPYHHVHTPPPSPADKKPELPAVLVNIIGRCMQKDPGARYQSTREILEEIRRTMSRGETSAG